MPNYEFASLMGKTVSEYGQSNVTDKNATESGPSRHQRVQISVLKRVKCQRDCAAVQKKW